MKVKELLSSRDQWTKRAEARDKNGVSVAPESPKAVCWCLYGALHKVYGRGGVMYSALGKLQNVLESKLNTRYVAAFNDSDQTNHETLMEVLNEANI